ncbi:MAG: ABC transporter permease subunit, partial [Nitrospirae bacterium]
IYISITISPLIESILFKEDMITWLYESFGIRYDQRNSIVVGIAMGFNVIPIIFALTEDALSNVPEHLIAASLALGANLWQTVMKIVIPAAGGGIFSAIMIGFGTAVGETMIVLMATGNVPVIDLSPFIGFRTLSANIATELPEAPWGSTHYRVLFFSALLLFTITFIVNTIAEVVRNRIRKKLAQL